MEFHQKLTEVKRWEISRYLLNQENPRRAWKKFIETERFPVDCEEISFELLEKLKQNEIKVIPFYDRSYPCGFKNLSNPPLLLFLKGNASLLGRKKKVAIIGARSSSCTLREYARHVSRYLSSRNLTVISGYALGIDESAHKGALEEKGSTIAVLGKGLLHNMKRNYTNLFKEITRKGLLISEKAPLNNVKPQDFLLRNRLIASLAENFIIINPAFRSGSYSLLCMAKKLNKKIIVIFEKDERIPEYLLKGNFGRIPIFDNLLEAKMLFDMLA
ncbi:MAG: DNA-processing protein DprA [Candidatus Coatesbacteria bacterium]|nr:DNA-processing protein DprA [Candidatus Coatesbacteria bacterium]